MAKALFGSIQSRLLVSFMVSALFAIGVVGVFNHWIRLQLEAEADLSLMSKARSLADYINRFNDSNLQSLEMGASLPTFVAFIEADEGTRNEPRVQTDTINTLMSLQSDNWDQFYTLSFGILDSTGRNILDTTPSNIGVDEGGASYFRQALVTGVSDTSRLLYVQNRGGAYYYYVVPIRRRVAPEPVIGLVRAEVSISAIQDLLLDKSLEEGFSDLDIMLFDTQLVRLVDTEQPETLFKSIQDYEQAIMNSLIIAELLPDLSRQRLLQPIPRFAYELQTMGEDAVFTSITEVSGVEQRVAAIRIPDLDWYLVVAKPTSQFYLPIQRQTQGLYLLFFTLMFGALGIALLISRSVTVPIRHLTRVAAEVAEGNLETKVPIYSKDEVGQLAETFNQMTYELKHVKSNLEQLVEERTQSLLEANAALKREINERERLEAKNIKMAVEAERTHILRNFIQDASHEFKTPLSVINIKTHLLKRYTDEKLHRFLVDIEAQSHSIETIVSGMVMMSDLDSSSEIELNPVFVDDFLKSVHELENFQFEKVELALVLDLKAGTAAFAINSRLMREAMHRILENAKAFTPAGGTVTLRSSSDEEWVEVRIEDTGVGMTESVLAHAFERFFRGDEAHTTRGFGLGLPIAKRIIELSDGTISISSSQTEGTSVAIRLPRSKELPQGLRREFSKSNS
jgi:signal transduction histidine kinase